MNREFLKVKKKKILRQLNTLNLRLTATDVSALGSEELIMFEFEL
jgi:hypothetical protein